jgi:hypothetical protein
MRVGVCDGSTGAIVARRMFDAGSDVTVGSDPSDAVVVANWSGPSVRIIQQGRLLDLRPGMRIHMCGDGGEGRVYGDFEELLERGFELPLPITVSRLNITLRPRLSMFVSYLTDDEADWPESGPWSDAATGSASS